jgi:AcrR family transcriptional regulator
LCIDSQIAHGSFYAYFSDKEDLFDFAFSTIIKTKRDDIKILLERSSNWNEFIQQHFHNVISAKLNKKGPVDHYIEYIMHKSEHKLDYNLTPFAFSYDEIAQNFNHLFLKNDRIKIVKIVRVSRLLFELAIKNTTHLSDAQNILDQLTDDLKIYEKGIYSDKFNE